MNKILLVISAVSVFSFTNSPAHAQFCPDLAGVYTCEQKSGSPYYITVRQSPAGSTMAYEFDSQREGYHRIVADGSSQNMESGMGRGTFSAVCGGGHLETTFILTTPQGQAMHVKDTLRKERGALVRIRLSLPSSQVKVKDVYVCRPYFPPHR